MLAVPILIGCGSGPKSFPLLLTDLQRRKESRRQVPRCHLSGLMLLCNMHAACTTVGQSKTGWPASCPQLSLRTLQTRPHIICFRRQPASRRHRARLLCRAVTDLPLVCCHTILPQYIAHLPVQNFSFAHIACSWSLRRASSQQLVAAVVSSPHMQPCTASCYPSH